MKNRINLLLISWLFFISGFNSLAQNTPIVVQADKSNIEIQPTMYGVFFEDINFAADGGVYAELVKNGSFEFNHPLMGWETIKTDGGEGKLLVINDPQKANNPRYLQIKSENSEGKFGISNAGFRGMGMKEGANYRFSLSARAKEGVNLAIIIELINSAGEKIGQAKVEGFTSEWKKNTVSFVCSGTDKKAKLNIYVKGKGMLDVDMLSLFPEQTWNNRENGLRADLVQLLYDLKPGFLRFPGGCIVEGRELATRFQWKTTVGDLENRKMIVNRWNTEFSHRPTPDYFQSFGLGFYEYFQLAEDLGAEPLPILNCGMACQFNTAEVVPLDELQPFIQDALDLIEFANGGTDTKWGKLRSQMGHPKPFNLKMLGIGNEQWGEQFVERYKIISEKVKAAYPDIKIVSGSGPSAEGADFEYLWGEMRKLKPTFVDEHYYKPAGWFLENANRYDNYDRKGPKVFAGEYAAQSVDVCSPENKNSWHMALAEAAFMTGLERNADVVYMTSYAPLFAHVEAWQWTPDLIWFDNLKSCGTANYYVQKLYSTTTGTHAVPAMVNGKPLTGQDSLYATANINKTSGEIVVKVVNVSSKTLKQKMQIDGVKKLKKSATLIVLQNNNLEAVNSIEQPKNVYPVESTIEVKGKNLNLELKPYSFTVLKLKKN